MNWMWLCIGTLRKRKATRKFCLNLDHKLYLQLLSDALTVTYEGHEPCDGRMAHAAAVESLLNSWNVLRWTSMNSIVRGNTLHCVRQWLPVSSREVEICPRALSAQRNVLQPFCRWISRHYNICHFAQKRSAEYIRNLIVTHRCFRRILMILSIFIKSRIAA